MFVKYRIQMGVNKTDRDLEKVGAARIRGLTGGYGVDCALDCAGAVIAERLRIESVRRNARVAFVRERGDDMPLWVSPDLLRKGLTLVGVWHYDLKTSRN